MEIDIDSSFILLKSFYLSETWHFNYKKDSIIFSYHCIKKSNSKHSIKLDSPLFNSQVKIICDTFSFKQNGIHLLFRETMILDSFFNDSNYGWCCIKHYWLEKARDVDSMNSFTKVYETVSVYNVILQDIFIISKLNHLTLKQEFFENIKDNYAFYALIKENPDFKNRVLYLQSKYFE